MSEEMKAIAGLAKKLATISGELGAVQKDAQMSGGSVRYMYHSADAVLSTLNHKLAANNIIVVPSAQFNTLLEPVDGLTRVLYDYQFLIIDGDTGATIEATWSQDAPMSMNTKYSDTPVADDKASGKAHTYAFKYWLMKMFMVSTRDDSDLDTNSPDDYQNAAPRPQPQRQQNGGNDKPSGADGEPEPVTQVEVFTNKKGGKQVKIDNATMFGFDALELLGLQVPHDDGTYEVPALLVSVKENNGYWNINALKLIEDDSVVVLDNRKWKIRS